MIFILEMKMRRLTVNKLGSRQKDFIFRLENSLKVSNGTVSNYDYGIKDADTHEIPHTLESIILRGVFSDTGSLI